MFTPFAYMGTKVSQLTPPTGGLQIWLNSNRTDSYSGSGTTWTDLSGNGYDFTLVNPSTVSTGSKTFFEFGDTAVTGNARYAYNTADFTGGFPFEFNDSGSFVVVLRRKNTLSIIGTYISINSNSTVRTDDTANFIRVNLDSGANSVFNNNSNGGGNDTYLTASAAEFTTSEPTVLWGRWDNALSAPNEFQHGVNTTGSFSYKTSGGTNGVWAPFTSANAKRVQFGNNADTDQPEADPLNQLYGEVLFYSKRLSDAELDEALTYARDYWGVT